jgi:predicted HTH domain antitoxin
MPKSSTWPAAQLAGLTRDEFLSELKARNIPAFRPTWEDVKQDMETLDRVLGPVKRA